MQKKAGEKPAKTELSERHSVTYFNHVLTTLTVFVY